MPSQEENADPTDVIMEDAESTSMDVDSNMNTHSFPNESKSSTNTTNITNNTNNTTNNVDPATTTEAKHTIEMLRGENISERVAAANKLEAVAMALGHRRAREELLPFISESVDDEDEVLIALSASLGKLVLHIGGPAHAHNLLPPLELLLTVEESIVRDNAIKSVTDIAQLTNDDRFEEQYEAMISRLATKEWFTARISACPLLASSIERLSPDNQEAQVNHFANLCRDDVPMVRRVASQHLGILLQNIVKTRGISSIQKDGVLATTLLPLYEELAINDQDSVRLQTTENCVAFGKAITSVMETDSEGHTLEELGTISIIERILPLVMATIDDRSWRVRWTAASKFADVVKSFAKLSDSLNTLIPAYEKLLQDPEAEVRTAATFNLSEVAKCNTVIVAKQTETTDTELDHETSATVAERLVKRVAGLTDDESEHVRAALAMVATALAPILGKESTISHLVPPVLLLLRDSAPEVRLNLISSLSGLNEVIGVDLLSQSLLPAIVDLAEDGKWRIRLAIIQNIPLLAEQLGKDFFSEQLSSLCVGWLGDDISSIRQAAASNLKDLTALFGADWASIHIIPYITEIRQHQSYLRRLTAVQACTLMSTVINPDVARSELLPIVLDMASDNVPNIRFNVARGLEAMSSICGRATCETQIRPVLVVLVGDSDRDVRFFASQALETLDQLAQGVNPKETKMSNFKITCENTVVLP